MNKLKNKINKKTGKTICGGIGNKGCGCDVGLGVIIEGYVYCLKCGNKITGKRGGKGLLLKTPEAEELSHELVSTHTEAAPVGLEPLLKSSLRENYQRDGDDRR